ncbi:uncharacterized protein LOC132559501 [Ylistrum balloti]|uniref:uncharacterized protein LOC132559501 n=1 Tax=Ylistrum balloti TaxID=509963 RepID=UPI002905A85D|nr:uncharacterized protein LOC132559501 [Ylistrum balloti]
MTTLVRLTVLYMAFGVCTGELVPLDGFSTESLDTFARKKLMFLIVQKLNETIEIQDSLKHQCDLKINQSIEECNACARSENITKPASVLGSVLPSLMNPIILVAGVVKDIEGSMDNAVNVLGDKTSDFIKDVGSVAKTAGDSLIDGVSDVNNDILEGLSTFQDLLTSLVTDLGHGLTANVHSSDSGGIDFGNSVDSSLDNFGDHLSQVAQSDIDSESHLGHETDHDGNSIGHAFTDLGHANGGVFGKRSVCSVCDKVNATTRTSDEILKDVCGEDEIHRQRAATAFLSKMQTFYDTAVSKAIVTKVEYDPTSIDVTNGVAFKTVYVNYTIASTPTRYQSTVPLRITNLPVTGDALGQEIFDR